MALKLKSFSTIASVLVMFSSQEVGAQTANKTEDFRDAIRNELAQTLQRQCPEGFSLGFRASEQSPSTILKHYQCHSAVSPSIKGEAEAIGDLINQQLQWGLSPSLECEEQNINIDGDKYGSSINMNIHECIPRLNDFVQHKKPKKEEPQIDFAELSLIS